MGLNLRFTSAAALAACASMAAAPLAAAELPQVAAPSAVETPGVFDADAVDAQNHRYWYRRNRVDAGDVIGAVVVLGTIAAVASAASKASQRDRDYRDRDYRYRDRDYGYDRDYRSRPSNSRWDDSRGLDRAVDMCAREVERSARIDTVEGANRTGNGWDVTGRTRTGDTFRCTIGNDGRIDNVDFGRGGNYRGSDAVGSAPAVEDRQWDDDRYTAARAAQEGTPAYPGGPLPGDPEPTGDDGRYQTAQAPDFAG
ncbi:hypothetical protein A6F68_01307 [Tsuneonella dongtanensis]|uniref:17 kDa surface antigen n=1 Tax=Tsuneonella dongtanensis TaxID=692370 RepID=A0A1B2ACJ0_9SPHN|nr:hypothetical protein [Tsuneonella dongtanensis]ANY19824.1 hypothetical protein A6F68_01307 [Tsuneonella dongtanensis]